MKTFLLSLLLLNLGGWNLKSQTKVPVLRFQELKENIQENKSSVQVINFWATWCAPCVREIPYFQAVHEKYQNQSVRFLLVSLDSSKKLARVERFVKKKKLSMEIVLLNETDFDTILPQIHPNMEGAIPATLFLCGKKTKGSFIHDSFSQKKLFQRDLSQKELEKEVKACLNR
ncbi:MAG: TlpA disulfide reductase family protein [Cytophagales bacterium]|nr:TlpA disulfide reductase family protein [Cytophagales bacterium]